MARTKGDGPNKMECMRQLLGAMGPKAKPAELQAELKSKYNINMSTGMVSNYKSLILKSEAKKSAVIRKAAASSARTAAKSDALFSVNDVQAIKELTRRLGADKVVQLTQVFG